MLLTAAGLLYLALGSRVDALMLLGFVLLSLAITLTQAHRTQGVLAALQDLATPQAWVLRDGQRLRIPGAEVARGDLMLLSDGDRVAADADLLQASDLLVDESILTGESLPVAKAAAGAEADRRVLAGCLVLAGTGWARVTETGLSTVLGRMGSSLQDLKSPDSPMALEIRGWVRRLSFWALALSAGLALAQGWLYQDWLGGLLAGITLAMALLPQELLIILTVFSVMAAWRLARQGVLVRRPATVEALGSTSVLCMDKTGTLTQNHMAVVAWVSQTEQRWLLGTGPPQSPETSGLATVALLACESERFDPMDQAIVAWASDGIAGPQTEPRLKLVHEYGLSPELMAMTHAWQGRSEEPAQLAMKGAPEAVISLCRLSPAQQGPVLAQANDLAAKGWRVLAVASASHTAEVWPETPHGFDWTLLGLLALADPLRPEAQGVVQACTAAGLRVLIITGDHAGTAQSIAQQIDLGRSTGVITGLQLEALPAGDWGPLVRQTAVFARVTPVQKLALIQHLQSEGDVVAMTGDGVNDAAALKAAHIGIAMGARGTDVAREAAALVLMDDQLGGIVHALRAGRRLEDNLRDAMAFAIAVHVPIAGLALTPLLLGWPTLLAPVHIAFLEMVISPVCAIVLEAEPLKPQAMHRPPRSAGSPLLSGALLRQSLLQGMLVWLLVSTLYGMSWWLSGSVDTVRSLGFTALLTACWGLILKHHTWRGGALSAQAPLAIVTGLTVTTWILMMSIEPVRQHLGFGPVSVELIAACIACGWTTYLALKGLDHRFHAGTEGSP
jgi:Ca2+-transporting ATPase